VRPVRAGWILWAALAAAGERAQPPLDQALRQAAALPEPGGSPGSLYVAAGRYADLASDFRAAHPGDIVTIVVSDQASALSKGSTSSARKSESKSSIGALFGPIRATTALGQLPNLGGDQKLDGQGETTRQTSISTTISARIVSVLPNGVLALEGAKDIWVNSERQQVVVRGMARWRDVTANNQVSSDRLASLEIRIQGKGVVGDAIRRPNFLYRLLLGLVPF
jgi:flagellar L-ring protein precursor FlgH